MKLYFFIISLLTTYSIGYSQYSIEGTVMFEYAEDTINPMPNVGVNLVELNKKIVTKKGGHYYFENIPEGVYTILIQPKQTDDINSLKLKIHISENIVLNPVRLFLNYTSDNRYVTYNRRANSVNTLQDLYKNNGSLAFDSTNEKRYHLGIYYDPISQPLLYSSNDSIYRYYRTGIWTWYQETDFKKVKLILHYQNGIRNGEYKEYYPNESIFIKGFYKNDKKHGIWEIFKDNGEKKYTILYDEDIICIEGTNQEITRYNELRLGKIHIP